MRVRNAEVLGALLLRGQGTVLWIGYGSAVVCVTHAAGIGILAAMG